MERVFLFLDRMRERPEHSRRALAVGIALGFTVFLLAVWGIFLFPRAMRVARESAPQQNVSIPTPNASNTEQKDWNQVWAEMQAKYGSKSDGTSASLNTQNSVQTGSTDTASPDVSGSETDPDFVPPPPSAPPGGVSN